ncbi:MAG: DUF535 family protein [Hydrogenovibrio sp.]|uniref:DUF535 family protein n=1 Tax=Hydrogenovibrio sp. TaxID=2065821 RepID=UPI0028705042|nr:DUF535 family protein [Hydrogenovibrio sp.]MDR9500047.1 DUF535 family protein [Hydrogenovibrio sp.]
MDFREFGRHLVGGFEYSNYRFAGKSSSLAMVFQVKNGRDFTPLTIHYHARKGVKKLDNYLNFLLPEKGALIGGVQRAKDSLELSRAFSKATQGIPPHKNLYIAFAALMAEWSVPAVYGIRHVAHVFQGEAKTQYKYKLKNFNYDVFWQDVLEGEVVDDDRYQLSAPYQRKPLDEVNAKKRGKLKKRYLFMDALEANVREFAQHV